MKDCTYNYIYKKIIKPCVISIKKSLLDIEAIEGLDFTVKDESFLKKDLHSLYEKKKDRVKKLYHYKENGDKRRIDIHKIAACMAATIIENPIIEYSLNIDKELPNDLFLANAKLAYEVSLGIIYIGIFFTYIDSDIYIDNLKKHLILPETLQVPPTTPGHDSYNKGRIKTLALNDVFSNEFDVLTYADMMFWIEYYNRQLIENTLTPVYFRDITEDLINQYNNVKS